MEGIVETIWRSLINLSLKHFGLFANLLSIARLALVLLINDFALSTAIVTRCSALSVHARSEHLHFGHHTAPFALTALGHSAVLSTATVALSTDALTVHFNFGSLSIVDFLERDLEWVLDWLAFLGSGWLLSAAATASKHLRKKVIHACTLRSSSSFSFEHIFAIFIVLVALLSI